MKQKHKGQGRERLEGGGRKVIDDNFDEIILEWIHGRRANGLRVSRKLIMVKAKRLYEERCPKGEQDLFKATAGWLQKFMLRNGLSLRRKTTTVQQDPHRVIDKLISYILHVRRFSQQRNYQPSCIIAMDETPVWDDIICILLVLLLLLFLNIMGGASHGSSRRVRTCPFDLITLYHFVYIFHFFFVYLFILLNV